MEETVRLPLTQGKFALIDAADYERVAQFRWCALNKEGLWYVGRTARDETGRRYTLYLHRFLTDTPNGVEVDHENGDGLDNRRLNLRICDHMSNTRNQGLRSDNITGYKGVRRARSGLWWVAIRCGGERIHLGTFTDPRDAARVYDAKARELFGEFARTNFPPSDEPLPIPLTLAMNNSSGYRGVSWHRMTGKWSAVIQHEGNKHHLGTFDNAIDAARVYDASARELHGGKARYNFPDDS